MGAVGDGVRALSQEREWFAAKRRKTQKTQAALLALAERAEVERLRGQQAQLRAEFYDRQAGRAA